MKKLIDKLKDILYPKSTVRTGCQITAINKRVPFWKITKRKRCKFKMHLTEEHLKVMKAVKNGATIYGLNDAQLLREVQKYDKDLITIIDDMKKLEYILGYELDGAKQLPYFGAILTKKGKKYLKENMVSI